MFSETKWVVFVPEPKIKVFNNINNNPKVIIFHDMWNMERFMCRLKPVDCLSLSLISLRWCRCRLKSQQLTWQQCVKYSDCIKTDVQFQGATPLVAERSLIVCKYMRKWPDLPQHVVHLVKHASTESQIDDNSECASDALWLTSDPIKKSSPASPR